jgi:23S rRNA pseudouridine2605 synthase
MRRSNRGKNTGQRTGLARALSKLGFCSRSRAWALIESGRVRVNGVIQRDPEKRVELGRDRIEVDGNNLRAEKKVYLMLNKPRGLVTTASDEKGRDTVFQCFDRVGEGRHAACPEISDGGTPSLRHLFPVGRLDKASEGLLLFTNDTAWAARITEPESHVDKTYHVQVDCLADDALARRIQDGVVVEGEFLAAKRASVLRHGDKNSWLEIVLDEGKNRHIRRLLAAMGVAVLRLVRVAVGPLALGALAKGKWRHLTRTEVSSLAPTSRNKSQGAVRHAD